MHPLGRDEKQEKQQQQQEEQQQQQQQSKGQATREADSTVTKTRHHDVTTNGMTHNETETTVAVTDTAAKVAPEVVLVQDHYDICQGKDGNETVTTEMTIATAKITTTTGSSSDDDVHDVDHTLSTATKTTTTVTHDHPPASFSGRPTHPRPERPDFHMGDHVYQWCRFLGIPGVFQHHGIVLDVVYDDHDHDHHHHHNNNNNKPGHHSATQKKDGGDTEPHYCGEWYLVIADFSNWTRSAQANQPGEEEDVGDDHASAAEQAAAVDDNFNHRAPSVSSSSSSSLSSPLAADVVLPTKSLYSNSRTESCIRTYRASSAHWHKVEYNAKFWKRHFLARSGTCTAAESCPPALVRARLDFLLRHPNYLPPYSAVHSNCECVAVWCKTGTWGTLQATSWLTATAAGQAKSAATLAGVVSTTTVTVPSAGLWGWMGYTTQVSLAATQPYLLPAIAAYGIVTVGVPALWLWHAKQKWKQWTIELNEAFWDNAVDYPELFVECITHWANSPNRDHVAAASTKVVTNKNEAAEVMGNDDEEEADGKPAAQKSTRTTEAGR